MKILVTGKTGQVGYELVRSLQCVGEVVAVSSAEMDLSKPEQVREVIRTVKPQLIINTAAYTAVDQAEKEAALAMAINGEAPALMAKEAKRLGAAMIHFSTDYVFDGRKDGAYIETDVPAPLNVYGQTKLAGERAVQAAAIPHLIFRTSWVYGMRGRNFLLTMLRLAQERNELRIVADQHGAPTWCRTLADACAAVVCRLNAAGDSDEWWIRHAGLYHLTAQGHTTWHGFANAILDLAELVKRPELAPIPATNYPTPAKRPANSVLSCQRFEESFCQLPAWDQALAMCLEK
jgi:dTDP-4-dehydrorhamnose reductase